MAPSPSANCSPGRMSTGANAREERSRDLVKAGIIDPAKAARIALQDSASIAGALITPGAMVAEKPGKAEPLLPPGGTGDMGVRPQGASFGKEENRSDRRCRGLKPRDSLHKIRPVRRPRRTLSDRCRETGDNDHIGEPNEQERVDCRRRGQEWPFTSRSRESHRKRVRPSPKPFRTAMRFVSWALEVFRLRTGLPVKAGTPRPAPRSRSRRRSIPDSRRGKPSRAP